MIIDQNTTAVFQTIIPLWLVTSLHESLNCIHFSLQWLNTYSKKTKVT